MEVSSDFWYRKQSRLRQKRRLLVTAIVVIISIVLIVPLAILLPRRKHSHGLESFVLLPLYSYPGSGAWQDLYEVLDAQPDLNFTIIINPDDGPGSDQYPQDDYVTAISNLSSHSNVRMVGYVHTSWATRNISSVLTDVSKYSGWAAFNGSNTSVSSIAMHGIFFDETPNEYSSAAAEYLRTINQAAKNASGILQDRLIIHNPGTAIDARLDDTSTDITVVFENSYQAYKEDEANLTSFAGNRSRRSYMIHTVPSMSVGNLGNLVNSLSESAQALFVTNLSKDYYESFGTDWKDFVDSVVP